MACAHLEIDAGGYCEACGLKVGAGGAKLDFALNAGADLAIVSDRGRRHTSNQDAGVVARREDGAVLLVVADGVSSSQNAAGASEAAVAACVHTFVSAIDMRKLPLADQARMIVEAAAQAVLDVARGAGVEGLDPPETTIVLVLAHEGHAGFAWVGDSRAYVLQAGATKPVTVDDSWAEQMISVGKMDRDTAMRDPRSHAILQCLGMGFDEIDFHICEAELPADSGLLLCSDGFWNYFETPELVAAAYAEAQAEGEAQDICRKLVARANSAGGRDNITVALLRPVR
ncbi:PP2C family protein-serine/threonine phosphatase [Methylovirgula sp. 4M-Z18]|uniref:PP2C family protein-serine/threonine phosphatase n=1 Tax=Methylovirgula sp. 4M-Z18 TaxID=2293567 RepID=UPI00131437FA|nr:protein phosphatase 2C domain-containing protein [Methylovirgula sp. 4M-Z18]